METIFIISFIVLCFSVMILLEVNDSNKTWQMIVWRLLFVLSTLGSGISFVFVLTSKYDFHIWGCFLPLIGLAFLSLLGAVMFYCILGLIAWIFGTKSYIYIDYLTGQH